MASLPGSTVDVYFGDAEKSLPNWRDASAEREDDGEAAQRADADDDTEPTEEERRSVAAMLGFDPAKLDDEPERNARQGRPVRGLFEGR